MTTWFSLDLISDGEEEEDDEEEKVEDEVKQILYFYISWNFFKNEQCFEYDYTFLKNSRIDVDVLNQ